MSAQVVLVGTVDSNLKLYLIVGDASPGKDAMVVSGDKISEVGLWSYVAKMDVTPLRTTSWHQKLWDGPEDDDWRARFWDRTKPFSANEIKEMGAVSSEEILASSQDDGGEGWFDPVSSSGARKGK